MEKQFIKALRKLVKDPLRRRAILAMAKLETGNFTSKLTQYHNYFGIRWFKKPGVETVMIPTKAHGDTYYRVFSSPAECIECMLDIVRRLHKKADKAKTIEKFMEELSKGWCPIDKKYLKKWTNIFNQLEEETMDEELKGKAASFVSKRLGALGSLIPVIMNPQIQSDMKELYAIVVGVFIAFDTGYKIVCRIWGAVKEAKKK